MNDPSKFESAFAIGFELSNNFLSRIRGRGIGNNPAYKRAMLFFLCKALRTYQGAHHLWVGGYMEDGRSLARGIFEIRLQARYMVIEPDIRSAQFTRHWQRSSWRALRRWAASGRVRGLRIEGHDPKRAKARPPVNENWWEKKEYGPSRRISAWKTSILHIGGCPTSFIPRLPSYFDTGRNRMESSVFAMGPHRVWKTPSFTTQRDG
jgi:hypothetical protein